MSRRLMLPAALAATGLAACAPGYDAPMSQRAAMRFDAELAGMVAGPPQQCLPPRSTASVVAVREGTVLFREGARVYANHTGGGCDTLDQSGHTLVTENFGGSLCRGSLARVVDLSSPGIIRGTCVLGDFTPYRRR